MSSRATRARPAANVSNVVVVAPNPSRRPARRRTRGSAVRSNPYLRTLLNPFHFTGKIPDLVTEPSCEIYQFTSVPVVLDANGCRAYTFDPCVLAVYAGSSLQSKGWFTTSGPTTGASAPFLNDWAGLANHSVSINAPGITPLISTFSGCRLVSAAVMYLPSLALSSQVPIVAAGLIPSGTASAWQATWLPNTAMVSQGYGAAIYAGNTSIQVNYRPVDAQTQVYTPPATTTSSDNAIAMQFTGGAASSTVGTIYLVANYEAIPGPYVGGFIAPSPSPAKAAWMEQAMNVLASQETVVTQAAFYSSPMTDPLTAAMTAPSVEVPGVLRQALDVGSSALSSMASGASDVTSRALSAAGASAQTLGYMAGAGAATAALTAAYGRMRNHLAIRDREL